MAAAQEAENHGDEWGLTWYFLWGIYTSIPTQTYSQNSLAFISTRIVISYAMKWMPHCEFDEKSMETETTTFSEFPNGGKAIVEEILASRKK